MLNRQKKRQIAAGPIEDFARQMAGVIGESEDGFSIVLLSDRAMRGYNRSYRNVDASTDVLSFPAGSCPAGGEADPYLGDILVSVERAAEQADERGASLLEEIRSLVLHGYLHLLGYDHETDRGEMMRRQQSLERELFHGN